VPYSQDVLTVGPPDSVEQRGGGDRLMVLVAGATGSSTSLDPDAQGLAVRVDVALEGS
jgi:hypothetical protein